MYELILGFTLAVIFIVSYLLISNLFSEEKALQGKMPVTLNPANSDRAIGDGQIHRGLLNETNENKDVA